MKGLVYKSTGNWYDVHTDSKKIYKCNIKGKFRSLGIKSTNPVAVGDRVLFEITDEQDLKGLIIKIEDREGRNQGWLQLPAEAGRGACGRAFARRCTATPHVARTSCLCAWITLEHMRY